jgi:mono/diheme cytochrome c family protein
MRQSRLLQAIAGVLALVGSAGISVAAEVQLAQAADQATLTREGQPLYVRNCAVCHGQQGQGDMGPKLALSEFIKSAPALVSQILNGEEGHGMPPFKDTLNDRQIAAISTYVRNSWGNTAGVVTPTDVAGNR